MVKLELTQTVWSLQCFPLLAVHLFICILCGASGDPLPEGKNPSASPVISVNSSSTMAKSPNLLTVFSNSSKDIVELLLNSSSAAIHAAAVADPSSPEKVQINLDETRSELLRVLQSQVLLQEDSSTHEQLQTISEARLRAALDKVLQRQLNEARRKGLETLEGIEASTAPGNQTTPNPNASAFSSQLVCQFFVFGTLFGVVCSISTCTCCLKPRTERRRSTDFAGVNPTNVPAPIDYSKPYMLKCDSRGSCYASPLSDDEVPPLPSYADALECARQPTPTRHPKPADAVVV